MLGGNRAFNSQTCLSHTHTDILTHTRHADDLEGIGSFLDGLLSARKCMNFTTSAEKVCFIKECWVGIECLVVRLLSLSLSHTHTHTQSAYDPIFG